MNRRQIFHVGGLGCFLVLLLQPLPLRAEDLDRYFEDEDIGVEEVQAADQQDHLEPLNRLFFTFNDKLYFWALKPASTVYAAVLPEDSRIALRNAFSNLLGPVRVVNNFLQGKLKNSGTELARFVINSTFGIAGLMDVAATDPALEQKDEDLGQTLGVYGAGEGVFICWPFLGPSNLRDTVGMIGDGFLNPLNYLTGGNGYTIMGIRTGEKVNNTSLTLGDYERFKEAAIDPYVSMRQAYREYRENKIKDMENDKQISASSSAVNNSVEKKIRQGITLFFFNVLAAPAVQSSSVDKQFAVHIGMAIDPVEITDKKRDGYKFYGLQMPLYGGFDMAKQEERRLLKAGYPLAPVVAKQ